MNNRERVGRQFLGKHGSSRDHRVARGVELNPPDAGRVDTLPALISTRTEGDEHRPPNAEKVGQATSMITIGPTSGPCLAVMPPVAGRSRRFPLVRHEILHIKATVATGKDYTPGMTRQPARTTADNRRTGRFQRAQRRRERYARKAEQFPISSEDGSLRGTTRAIISRRPSSGLRQGDSERNSAGNRAPAQKAEACRPSRRGEIPSDGGENVTPLTPKYRGGSNMRNVVGFGTARESPTAATTRSTRQSRRRTRGKSGAYDSSPRLHRPGELRRRGGRRHQVRRVKGTTLDDFRNSARGGLPERWE